MDASTLFAGTVQWALPILQHDHIIALNAAGLEAEACELYTRTGPDGPKSFRIDDIARLCSAGMKDMANDLYSQTVEFVILRQHFPVDSIVKMYAYGLMSEARELYWRTVEFTPQEYKNSHVTDLYAVGLHAEAMDLFDNTSRFSAEKPKSPNTSHSG